MIEAKKAMPDKPVYFNKYLDARFQHIDESIDGLKGIVVDLKQEIKATREETKEENRATREKIEEENRITREEVKASTEKTEAENRLTRKWVVTTAISLMVGFVAIAVSIFFGFAKLQTSWIQTVISFVGKTVVK